MQYRCQRGPHTATRRILGRPAGYLRVGLADSQAQRPECFVWVDVAIVGPERLDHRGAGQLASGMAAEAVSNGEQPPARIGGVLVALPDQASLRRGSSVQSDRFGHRGVHLPGIRQVTTVTQFDCPTWMTYVR